MEVVLIIPLSWNLNHDLHLLEITKANPLHPKEQALALRISHAKRRQAFLAGRSAAHASLDAWGGPRLPILKTPIGAPNWQPGVIGSISHADQWAGAVTCEAGRGIQGVGLDLESRSRQANPQILGKIAKPEEILALGLSQEDFGDRELALFSLKEAVYKCLYPQVGEMFGFMEAQITCWEEGKIEIQTSEAIQKKGAAAILQGQIIQWEDLQIALVWY